MRFSTMVLAAATLAATTCKGYWMGDIARERHPGVFLLQLQANTT
jgi:hypothetical protein